MYHYLFNLYGNLNHHRTSWSKVVSIPLNRLYYIDLRQPIANYIHPGRNIIPNFFDVISALSIEWLIGKKYLISLGSECSCFKIYLTIYKNYLTETLLQINRWVIHPRDLQGTFHNNFPGLLGFIFCRKLACMKTQQGTDKASENNGCTA